jgi:hypothetical protein
MLDGSARVPAPGDTVVITFETQHALVYGATGELLAAAAASTNHEKRPVPVFADASGQ